MEILPKIVKDLVSKQDREIREVLKKLRQGSEGSVRGKKEGRENEVIIRPAKPR